MLVLFVEESEPTMTTEKVTLAAELSESIFVAVKQGENCVLVESGSVEVELNDGVLWEVSAAILSSDGCVYRNVLATFHQGGKAYDLKRAINLLGNNRT